MSIDIQKVRSDFPILNQRVYQKPLVYLDNGATTQKPKVVIDEVAKIYSQENANIHRGVHYLSEQLTQKYEDARKVVQEFIHAAHGHEVVFTSGTTESINTIAYSFGEKYIHEGDEIIISTLEHHANIVPWQMLCERKNASLKVIPVNDKGELLLDEYEKLIASKTKIVAVNHVSNALGTINDVKKIIDIAHQKDIPVLIDGAQSIQHGKVDVQELDCDFYAFSGHKIYGPNGIGVLYGKEKWLNELPPFMTGGEMIKNVTFEKTTFNELPFKFEAGTPNYVGAIGLAKAIEYIQGIGLENIESYEKELLEYATQKLSAVDGLKIIGTSAKKISVISFILKNIHHYDAGMVIDKMGVAVRTGHHCAEPVMHRFNIEGTIRASFAFYNTKEEVDRLCEALMTVKQMFG
ncbi:MAG: cysteine desulfurase / selenocysteine lyase [Bacteroidales bacterium]|nr:cysteine desulfurase / selenocysteine lyase [Bacteroidales bacterium]